MADMKKIAPKPEHHAFFEGLKDAVRIQGKDLQAEELTAITAKFLGMLCAFNDRRKYTPSMLMDIVIRNLQVGNQEAINITLGDIKGGPH
jgi:hypothetical protein